MIKNFLKNNPVAGYYIIAIAFPTLLFTYLVGLDIIWQSLHDGESYAGKFYALRDQFIAQHQIIF